MKSNIAQFIVLGRRNGITALKSTTNNTLAYTRTKPMCEPHKQIEYFDVRFVAYETDHTEHDQIVGAYEKLRKEFLAINNKQTDIIYNEGYYH